MSQNGPDANFTMFIGDHLSITSAKKWVGGVRKWQFLLIYIIIYADVGGWVGLKKPKKMQTYYLNGPLLFHLFCFLNL